MNIIKNINELARKSQKKTVVLGLIAVGSLICVGWLFVPEKASTTNPKQQIAQMDGATNAQFTQDASQKIIQMQQQEILELRKQLQDIGKQMDALQKTFHDERVDYNTNTDIQTLQIRIAELEDALHKNSSYPNKAENSLSRGITTITFSYADNAASQIKTATNYVPAGTFAKAVLLSGADTNAGVQGQTDTTPITMRILDDGTLPNGRRSSLRGCFVTAAAYGDASSERGQIRLQRLSCIRKPDNQVLDIAVEGTINDMGGSDGIRGHLVMRNNKLIWNAGVSGMLSGVGQAVQQSLSTQTVSPLGVTNTVMPSKIFQAGTTGGVNTAMGKLADYYIKLADMYHPIVQVHAGSKVNIVFLKGFSLSQGTDTSEKPESNITTQTTQSDELMQNIKNSQLGQEIGVGVN